MALDRRRSASLSASLCERVCVCVCGKTVRKGISPGVSSCACSRLHARPLSRCASVVLKATRGVSTRGLKCPGGGTKATMGWGLGREFCFFRFPPPGLEILGIRVITTRHPFSCLFFSCLASFCVDSVATVVLVCFLFRRVARNAKPRRGPREGPE